MKIISYKNNNKTSVGVLTSDTSFVNIDNILRGGDCLFLIQNFNKYKTKIYKSLKVAPFQNLDDVELLAPLYNPTSLRDAYAFRQHVETSRKNRGLDMIKEFDAFPVYYYSNHNAVIGPGLAKIEKTLSSMLDYELEIAAIIGKKGINISATNADKYIFGFTIMNDLSSRDIQKNEMKLNLGPSKGKDFATSIGPHITTIDELEKQVISTKEGNHYDIDLKGYLNNKLISIDNLKNMHWTFAQIIERISIGTYLYPGDVIGSGTCATGCLYELNSQPNASAYWLKNGDSIKIKADRLGVLKNKIKFI